MSSETAPKFHFQGYDLSRTAGVRLHGTFMAHHVAGAVPITIKYSDLIAERLNRIEASARLDDDAVKFREIGRTPWFL